MSIIDSIKRSYVYYLLSYYFLSHPIDQKILCLLSLVIQPYSYRIPCFHLGEICSYFVAKKYKKCIGKGSKREKKNLTNFILGWKLYAKREKNGNNLIFTRRCKGRPSGPNRLFFWTLFKRPLTPPPPPLVFEHLCCGFF